MTSHQPTSPKQTGLRRVQTAPPANQQVTPSVTNHPSSPQPSQNGQKSFLIIVSIILLIVTPTWLTSLYVVETTAVLLGFVAMIGEARLKRAGALTSRGSAAAQQPRRRP